jgi:hypothetical protein
MVVILLTLGFCWKFFELCSTFKIGNFGVVVLVLVINVISVLLFTSSKVCFLMEGAGETFHPWLLDGTIAFF